MVCSPQSHVTVLLELWENAMPIFFYYIEGVRFVDTLIAVIKMAGVGTIGATRNVELYLLCVHSETDDRRMFWTKIVWPYYENVRTVLFAWFT